MAHDPHHEGSETYYLEQLSMIAVCGAFAVAGIALYYWQRPILITMFGQNSMFQDFVVWSGITLLFLVLVRAVALWVAVGRPAPVSACGHGNDHNHDHAHACDHDHGHHHHDHDHGHHHHDHNHGHDHTHAGPNNHADHDHGWAPWRYVVLLVPIILFLLGLPNKGPKAKAQDVAITQTDEQAAPAFGSLIGAGPLPLQQTVLAAAALADSSGGRVYGMDFKSLESAAQDEQSRKEWKGKYVRVVGQYAPTKSRSDHLFALVRFRIQCCAADAVQYRIPVLCKETLSGFQQNAWVEVTGRVEFSPDSEKGGFMSILIVPKRKNIVPTNPDPNPYIQ
jgi:hypothetical protein